MSWINHRTIGLAVQALSIVARTQPFSHVSNEGNSRIDRLCRELGWSVNERNGAMLFVHFNDPYGITRKACIMDEGGELVTFNVRSAAVFMARDVQPDLLVYLLRRNIADSGIGDWGLHLDEHNNVTFHLMYQALADGVNSSALKYICESLVCEVADFDNKLRQSGLLA